MSQQLIIQKHQSGIDIAILEDRKLVELHRDSSVDSITVGDIFLAKPRKLLPGLNASFINIGSNKDAFLHYTDLGIHFKKQIEFVEAAIQKSDAAAIFEKIILNDALQKDGKIVNVLPKKTMLMVQVVKEPISTKGPRITTALSLAGRYVVVIPFDANTTISRKISSLDERTRLKNICEALRPANMGIIVRTAAEGCLTIDLQNDINDLLLKWQSICDKLYQANTGIKLLSEDNKTTTLLRDLMNSSFDRIWVNDAIIHKEIELFLSKIEMSTTVKLDLYVSNKITLFDHLGVNQQIKGSFSKHVNMESGSYLVVEKTEAMHVIDVNSGHQMTQLSQEDSALHINKEAATEIARQIRLRDLGGLIVIDFIDMKMTTNKSILLQHFRDKMSTDRARHSILPLSKFSICEITRERTRPEVQVLHDDTCHQCNGSGKQNDTPNVINYIEKKLKYLFVINNHKQVVLHTNQYVNAFITKGFWSILRHWKWNYLRKSITTKIDTQLLNHQCNFYTADGETIVL